MRLLWDWLQKEACGVTVFKLVILFLIIDLCLMFGVTMVFTIIGAELPVVVSSDKLLNSPIEVFIKTVIISPLVEELAFRFVPLAIAIDKFGTSKKVLLVAVISSVVFGLLHGNFLNIAIQGTSGFLFCVLFLKCGGFQKRYGKATASSFLLHSSYNMSFLLMVWFMPV